MRIRSLALVVFLLCPAGITAEISPESGAFFLQDFPSKIYGAEPQNWSAVQDARGVMFFGNSGGILEYDGQRWRRLVLPNASAVRSLAIDESGTIYVGGQREFGFLKPDASGSLQYVSLLPHVAPADRMFNDVWTVLKTKSGMVFSSYLRLFRWSPTGRMQVWKSETRFSVAFLAGDVPYVIKEGSGLYRLVNDSLEPVRGGQVLNRSNVMRGAAQTRSGLVIATTTSLVVQHGDNFQSLRAEMDPFLNESHVNACLPLDDGTLAIATDHRGLLLLDSEGKLLRAIARDSGLPGTSINSLYRDRDGGLWLAMNSGLARLDISRPVTRFTERAGLEEIVLSIQRQDGSIYIGTMAGVSRLITKSGDSPRFEPVPGIHGQALALLSTPHGLLAGTPIGLQQVTGKTVSQPLAIGAMDALEGSSSDPTIAYAVGRNGLFVLRLYASNWTVEKHIESGGQEFRTVAEERDGRLWVTTRAEILRINLNTNSGGVARFSAADGVPPGFKGAYRVNGRVVFATDKGVFRFDDQSKRFVVDQSLSLKTPKGFRPVSMIFEAPGGDIWTGGSGYHAIGHRKPNGDYEWEANVLESSGIAAITGLLFDEDGTIWAAGADGELVRFQPRSRVLPAKMAVQPLLRRVQVVGVDQAIYGGVGNPSPPKLRHSQNALHFEFAAPGWGENSATDFRTRLDGLDRDWSDWTSEGRKEYTNLWEGSYLFRVQARGARGALSAEAAFPFRVLPPLYRQWWAYFLYVALVCGIVWLIVRWRLSAIEAQNRKLESVINERTEEIRKQRDEIKAQHDEIKAQEQKTETLLLNILPAKIAEELRTTGTVQPLTCDNITVCFTDFVGFTLSSEAMPACELVEALDEYFSEFDQIVDRYGLEKLKTIGDSYMFVSGLPQPKETHAIDAVRAALEIVNVVKRRSNKRPGWQIRVGVHSGPVVAGVVGLRKFAFDIWGETVNFASRHESSGMPNCVNISARTYELVREYVHCEPRGPIRIKEGRYLEMYLAHDACKSTDRAG